MDLLRLKVPKLFAEWVGEKKDEAVAHEFSAFLVDYIFQNGLKHAILGKMNVILVRDGINSNLCMQISMVMKDRNFMAENGMLPLSISQNAISDKRDEFQQLVLAVVRKEVVSEFKNLEGEKTIPSPLYGVLHVTVTTLCKDISWLQTLTTKQWFCWGIVASCCEKIPVAKEQFDWIRLYKFLITHLGYIYNSYCVGKKVLEDKCLLLPEGFPKEIAHISSEDIRKYKCRQIGR